MANVKVTEANQSLFAMLAEANQSKPRAGLMTQTSESLGDILEIAGNTIGAVNDGLKLSRSYLQEELLIRDGQMTEVRVDKVKTQLTAMGQLIALGATTEEAILLAVA